MWTTLKLRALRLFRRGRLERELDEEMRHHRELSAREHEGRGVAPAEARRLAALEFGSVDRFKEEYRDATGLRLLEDLQRDISHTVRSLRRTPAFTIAAIATLALGIGAATAVFSVVNGVLLRPLPYAESDRLVRVWQHDRASGTLREESSVPDFVDYTERARLFDAFAAHAEQPRSLVLTGTDPERVISLRASHSLFEILNTPFIHGRGFSADEDIAGGPRVVVLSERLWRTRLNADERVLGSTLRLDGEPYTVIGVIAAGAGYPGPHVDVWEPLAVNVAAARRQTHDVDVIARLAPGSTVGAADAETAHIMAELEAEYPASNRHRGGSVELLQDVLLGSVRVPLLVLLGAALLLLVTACANVGNLLLARNAARSRETAVRAALGAGRTRLLRQFFTETLCLTFAAGAAGGVLAWLALRVLLTVRPPELPRIDSATLDLRVLAGMAALCCVIALTFALLPALQSRRSLTAGALGARGSVAGAAPRLRRALVSAQLALSLVLLIGSGLLVRSFNRLAGVDPGFTADHVLKAEFQLPTSRYPRDFSIYPDWPAVHRFYDDVVSGLESLPGVASVALAAQHPLQLGFTNSFVIVGRESEFDGQPEIRTRAVTSGYMETIGARLVAGRALEPRDDVAGAAPVVVINEAAARQHFPAGDALGSRIAFWGVQREVVGIVGDERIAGMARDAPAALYTPLSQTPMHSGVILLRTTMPPRALARDVRRVVAAVDAELALFAVEPLDATVAASIARERLLAALFVAFAAAALLLGVTGVYGLIAYLLAQRSHEVGVRAAMGATPGMLRRMFLREGLLLACAGSVLGLVSSFFAMRVLQALLFGVSVTDVPTHIGAVSLLLLVAAAATWLPARRASEVSPLRALRAE